MTQRNVKTVWCAISAHGYGHAAQVVHILNEWGKQNPAIRVILRTEVPEQFFRENLKVRWQLQLSQQDVGCVQQGPFYIDIPKTWDAYKTFHDQWDQKIEEEAQAILESKPDLVVSNISYLAIAAAHRLGYPCMALASLSWDQVLLPYRENGNVDQESILCAIQNAYALSGQLIRLYPAIDMPVFKKVQEVGPIVPLNQDAGQPIKDRLGIPTQEALVLLAFGGIPVTNFPFEEMGSIEGMHFIGPGFPKHLPGTRIHRVEDARMNFEAILSQADIIMSKPGYATLTSAVHHQVPLVYVRRHNFVDEPKLVDYVCRFGRAVELPLADFETGNWGPSLHAALGHSTNPENPPQNGNEEAAALLQSYLQE